MARSFDLGSSEYLRYAGAPVIVPPFSMTCWAYPLDITNFSALMAIASSGNYRDTHYLGLAGHVAGDPVYAVTGDAGAWGTAETSSGYSSGSWQHFCGVWSATNARAVYLDGANKGTDATSKTPAGIDQTALANRWGNGLANAFLDGRMAWPAIWNVALTDAEVAQLAAGFCPLLIRPQNLVAFWPLGGLHGANDNDIVGGYHLTAINTPTWAEHPGGLWYPSGAAIGLPIPVAADVYPIASLRTFGRRPPIRHPASHVVPTPRRLPFVPFLSTVARQPPARRPGSRLPWPGYTPAPSADVYPISALHTTGRRGDRRRPASRVVPTPRRIPLVPILLPPRAAAAAARRRRRRRQKSLAADPAVFRTRFQHDARGLYRVFNAAEYRFYRSNAAPPVEGDVPFATSATLPHTPADLYADGTWYLSASYFNGVIDSGFLPLGPAGETYLRLDLADGEESDSPPAGPTDWRLELDAGGVVRVVGFYWESGALRADTWSLAYTVDGGDPPEDTPDVTVAMAAGLAVLDYALPAQPDGTTVKVRLQTSRDDDDAPVYSEASEIKTATADAAGPTAPLDAQRWAGRLPAEE